MRSLIWLFALAPAALLAFHAASAQTSPSAAAQAPQVDQAPKWCGFLDKAGARVRCGFVKQQDCEKALDNSKDAVCMPDPEFALTGRRNADG